MASRQFLARAIERAAISITALMTSAALSIPAFAGPPVGGPPTNAQPGMCFAQVKIPAKYGQQSQTVVTQDAHSILRAVPPKITSRSEQVETKEAGFRYEVRQPSYKTVMKRHLISPSYETLSVTPARFKTITETIQTKDAQPVWKKGNPGQLRAQGYKILSTAQPNINYMKQNRSSHDYDTRGPRHCGPNCEIWCLVIEPGRSASYTRRILDTPAKVNRHHVPAKYASVSKQVMADPGGVRKIQTAPQYQSLSVKEVVRPARIEEQYVPEKHKDVGTKTLIASERYEWRQVVCDPGHGVQRHGVQNSTHRRSSHIQPMAKTHGHTRGAARVRYHERSTGRSYSHGQSSAIHGQSASGSHAIEYGGVNADLEHLAGARPGRSYYYGTNLPAN